MPQGLIGRTVTFLRPRTVASVGIPAVMIALLVASRFMGSFLLFHTLVELYAVIIGVAITLAVYYTYPFTRNNFLLFIGAGFFWVACLDLFHLLTYRGMHVFAYIVTANITTTMWIAARILEVSIILFAPFVTFRHIASEGVFTLFGLAAVGTIVAAFIGMTPAMFVEERGLTPLKIALEYGVMGTLAVAVFIYRRMRARLNPEIYRYMVLSMLYTIAAEGCFTLYIDVYGLSNLLGHILKFLSYWMIFRAVLVVSLNEPFSVLAQKSSTYDVVPLPIAIVGSDGRIWQVNDAARAFLRCGDDAIIGASNHALFHPRGLDAAQCPVCRAAETLAGLTTVEVDDTAAGRFMQFAVSPLTTGGARAGMVQIAIDVTDLHTMQHRLLKEGALFKTIINTVPVRIFWKDTESVYLGANTLFARDAGLDDPALLIGKRDDDLVWRSQAALYRADDHAVMESKTPKLHYEEPQTQADRTIWLSTSKVPLTDEQTGDVVGVVGTYIDVTELKEQATKICEQNEQLYFQAHHDPLTRLPNRLLLMDRLNHALAHQRRSGGKTAVMFIDLDRFKGINDAMGHTVGDTLLQAISRRLSDNLRSGDTVARFGGDEFIVMIETGEEEGYREALTIATKLLQSFAQPFVIANDEYVITASIGITLSPDHGTDAETLIKNADSAMYRAKEEGRNTFSFYTREMTASAMERMQLEKELRRAIDLQELCVYYQPQIDMLTGGLIGLEALVRWNKPESGIVSPATFIPLAEETGLIVRLGEWVMTAAMEDVARWHERGLAPGTLAINLSAKQFAQSDLEQTVVRVMERSRFDPAWLELEVTESYMMQHPDKAVETLQRFRRLGCRLAIDDFGTGYSSLAYLKQFPITKLKIDQSFLRDIPGNPDDEAIVNTIIAMGRSMNLQIIAEGVETVAQMTFLQERGCTEGQGYLFAKPLPPDQIEALLIGMRDGARFVF